MISAIEAECAWTSTAPTPLELALLTNLLSESEALNINDRGAAQHLIHTLYKCEYSGGEEAGRRLTDDYARQLMERYRLDLDGIYDLFEVSE